MQVVKNKLKPTQTIMKRSKATEQPRVKCIVPICTNYYSRKSNGKVAKGDLDFFNVPSTGHLVYGKWCALLQLSGRRTEKICSVHFRRTDFIESEYLYEKKFINLSQHQNTIVFHFGEKKQNINSTIIVMFHMAWYKIEI